MMTTGGTPAENTPVQRPSHTLGLLIGTLPEPWPTELGGQFGVP